MEASKLKISPEHLRFKPMPKAKRSALRRENIKALIRSKPAGTVIALADFSAATQSSQASAHSMVKTMIKRGEIIKVYAEGHARRYAYVVNEPVVKQPAKPKATPQPAEQAPEPTPAALDLDALVAKAKDFVWSENSDSLREFIKWVGK